MDEKMREDGHQTWTRWETNKWFKTFVSQGQELDHPFSRLSTIRENRPQNLRIKKNREQFEKKSKFLKFLVCTKNQFRGNIQILDI